MNLNDYLPIEMIREIFSYLSIRDNLRCRSVCKLWRSVSSSLNYTKLSIVRQNSRPAYSYRLCAAYEPAKSIHLIAPTNVRCLSRIWKEATFRNVREMSTFFSNVGPRYLQNFYNHFAKLETLTIDSNDTMQDKPFGSSNKTVIVLKLKCLKKLIVNSSYFYFTLHTPELLHLECEYFPTFFNFAYVDKIRFLSVAIIRGRPQKGLSALEFLVVRDKFSASEVRLLSGLVNLKEVHLGCHHSELFDTLQKLEQLRKETNWHLNIFVFGLPSAVYERSWNSLAAMPSSARSFVPPDSMELLEENTAFMLRNLPMMAQRVLGSFAINYSDLEPLSAVEREAFLGRIDKIRSVSVSKPPENEGLLLALLEERRPEHLRLKCFEHHSDAFFNRLDFKFLRALSIEIEQSFSDFKQFSFLSKLENLTCLKVNFFSITFAVTTLKKVPHLKNFRLESNLITLKISIDSRMNVINFPENIRPSYRRCSYSFPNKSECIQFLGELENIKPTELTEHLPEPTDLFVGYLRFLDF